MKQAGNDSINAGRLKDMSFAELSNYVQSIGEKPYRAKQIFEWMYRAGVLNYDEMTNLSLSLRTRLAETGSLTTLSIHRVLVSGKDGTRKYVFKTEDGHLIETVFMQYRFGNSICISSQAGCLMGCAFCASGLGGLARNLTPGEMTDQLLLAANESGEEIRHIVVMGTGEPMDNYDNMMKFLLNITEPAGMGLGRRQITVSTCGLIPAMEQFLADLPQANLAISLHAPNDEIRGRIMPVTKKYSVEAILDYARRYATKTNRKITFEYALIAGVNDHLSCAKELAEKLHGINCLVNIIPLNSVEETALSAPPRELAEKFKEVLENAGIRATIRRELGSDIAAACGQLRLEG